MNKFSKGDHLVSFVTIGHLRSVILKMPMALVRMMISTDSFGETKNFDERNVVNKKLENVEDKS